MDPAQVSQNVWSDVDPNYLTLQVFKGKKMFEKVD